MKPIVFFLLLALLPVSCRKQPPQLPSNKGTDVDGSSIVMLNINQTIIHNEDSILLHYISAIDSAFIKSDIGFWYRISTHTNNKQLVEKSVVTISYQLLSLEEDLLAEEKQTIEIGKKQLPTGLEEGLKLMRKGETATFIVPWYLAYGMNGSDAVSPYVSVVFRVSVNEE